MNKIIHIDFFDIKFKESEFTDLLNKLNNLNAKQTSLNDLSFCPHFIIYKNEDDELIYENINEGYFNYLKENYEIINITNKEDIIDLVLDLINNKSYGLF